MSFGPEGRRRTTAKSSNARRVASTGAASITNTSMLLRRIDRVEEPRASKEDPMQTTTNEPTNDEAYEQEVIARLAALREHALSDTARLLAILMLDQQREGDCVLTVRELGVLFGSSRSCATRALAELRAHGWLRAARRRGASVRRIVIPEAAIAAAAIVHAEDCSGMYDGGDVEGAAG